MVGATRYKQRTHACELGGNGKHCTCNRMCIIIGVSNNFGSSHHTQYTLN